MTANRTVRGGDRVSNTDIDGRQVEHKYYKIEIDVIHLNLPLDMISRL